ncbi:uncharacterized protein [Apostichopus japonicus]|uniref:uncharacterized protein isoform X3 n=1 Tax=Stichopus japonicus TaxID=307972 RepID=UPI003AB7B63B
MVSVQQSQDTNEPPGFMEGNIERDCSMLGGLFQVLINDLKTSVPHWEDFQAKAAKFHTQLKATVVSLTAFLDSFQRLADIATMSRGATKDLGASLTRLCLRHKAIEFKLKSLASSLMDYLVMPLQDRIEDWKRITVQLDKDHAKDYKKARQEIKKKSSDTIRLQKKARKDVSGWVCHGKTSVQYQLDTAMQEVGDMYVLLEETEKSAVRKALVEERGRFCCLVNLMRPALEEELSMLGEIMHLQSVVEELGEQTKDPLDLPPASEQVILDVKGLENQMTYLKPVRQTPPLNKIAEEVVFDDDGDDSDHYVELPALAGDYINKGQQPPPPPSGKVELSVREEPRTPPSSPTLSSGSRKSSVCGSIGSMNSADSRSSSSLTSGNSSHSAHSHPSTNQVAHHRHRSLSTPLNPAHRLSSVSSQDSGFTSQDTLFMRPGTPTSQQQYTAGMQANHEYARQQSSGSASSSGDSTPSSSPCQNYAPMGANFTPMANQPATATLGRRSNRPKPVPTPSVPVKIPHEKLPDLPAANKTKKRGLPNYERPQQDQIVPQPKTPQEQEEDDWAKKSATLPRRSNSVATPYGIGGTIPRHHRPALDLNGSHDSGYDESGQILPPPIGFEGRMMNLEENPYLIPENDAKPLNSKVSQSQMKEYLKSGQVSSKPGNSRSATGTPTHQRHSSMGAIHTESNENTYQNMARSKLVVKERPPPPVRRTPPDSLPEQRGPTTQWENPTYAEAQFDDSGKFKLPHAVENDPSQEQSTTYDYPPQRHYQKRPPGVARSKSICSPSEFGPNRNFAQVALLENLNAKLAQRKSNPVTPLDNRASQEGNRYVVNQSTSQMTNKMATSTSRGKGSERTHPHVPPSTQQEGQRTIENDEGPVLYDYPTHLYSQSRLSAAMEDLPPPPEDFMTDTTDEIPAQESALQVAIKEKSRKLKRTETMDRSAPRISKD